MNEDTSPPPSSSNKRKGSDAATSDAPKSNKNKRLKPDTFTLESLRPFDFFITSPPITYAHIYPMLSDWLEGIVNEDFTIKSNPFVVPEQDLNAGMLGWGKEN
jgi:hypothetical protein